MPQALGNEAEEGLTPNLEHDFEGPFWRFVEARRAEGFDDEAILENLRRQTTRLEASVS